MNYTTEKLNFIFSLMLLAFSVYFIYYVFLSQYEKGYEAGKFMPHQEKKIVSREINMRALAVSTDEVITRGSGLYQTNCASCHGQSGKGDGPKAERLNPKPRNYSNKKDFRNGTTVLNLFQTVTNGIPGTSMPSFDLLPVDQRFAIVHFIRTLIPDPNSDTPETIAALPGSGDVSPVSVTVAG
ncbi:MAG: cytochrome c, partial [Patescibacteria group bacterium]|nr:cytochrome c [Patescibacteria group bacterium]